MPLVTLKIQSHYSRNKAYLGAQRSPGFPKMLEIFPVTRKLGLLPLLQGHNLSSTGPAPWQVAQSIPLKLVSSLLIDGNEISSGWILPMPVHLVYRRPADVPGLLGFLLSLFPPHSSSFQSFILTPLIPSPRATVICHWKYTFNVCFVLSMGNKHELGIFLALKNLLSLWHVIIVPESQITYSQSRHTFSNTY